LGDPFFFPINSSPKNASSGLHRRKNISTRVEYRQAKTKIMEEKVSAKPKLWEDVEESGKECSPLSIP
jgi:hypothetical protein